MAKDEGSLEADRIADAARTAMDRGLMSEAEAFEFTRGIDEESAEFKIES